MARLDGKVAVVSGGARGQGRAHAVTLASEGADIVICDVPGEFSTVHYNLGTEEDMQETVRLVEAQGQRCLAVPADVRNSAQVQTVADRAMETFGRVDILVCNAGIMTASDSTWEMSDEVWDEMLAVNLTGAWKMCRAMVPHILAGDDGGAIVLTGSTGGLRAVAGCTHYNAAKWGCIAVMRTLAWELAPKMIRVNVVHPTGVNTEMSNNEWFGKWLDEHEDLAWPMRGNRMPVDVIQPEDVSKTIAWLVSDDAKYVTGTEIRVDAGFMLK
jgi:SDR family mycofactocin-dependent oxidoreductase